MSTPEDRGARPDPPEGPGRTRPVSDELRPYVSRSEAETIDATADELREARAVPSPAFRAELKARLVELDRRGSFAWRPRNLKTTVGAFAVGGVALLVLAAVGVAGTGPLA